MTIRQVREVVAGLIHQTPDAVPSQGDPEEFFGSNPALEETVREYLASLPAAPVPPVGDMLLQVKLRLMFAAECLRQMEEASPQELIHGPAIPLLLQHMMIDQWPEHGKAWAIATFGPRLWVR